MLIYKVVKGEEAAVNLLKRMKVMSESEDYIPWLENIAHIGKVTAERVWEMSPTDDCYREYVILYTEVEKPGEYQYMGGMSDLRRRAYEDIRNGRVAE